mgnify:CR=1 FL=1
MSQNHGNSKGLTNAYSILNHFPVILGNKGFFVKFTLSIPHCDFSQWDHFIIIYLQKVILILLLLTMALAIGALIIKRKWTEYKNRYMEYRRRFLGCTELSPDFPVADCNDLLDVWKLFCSLRM